jgi:hypothetical protein
MGGLPIGVVIIVLLILSFALYVFLNTPSIFEGEWTVIKHEGEIGQQYKDVLERVTFSLTEDNEYITLRPTKQEVQPIVFRIQTMEPSHIVAESHQEHDKMSLEFNVEDPNTNEVSLVLKAYNDPKEMKAILYYGNG